jgi:hypothetical protein
MTTAEDKKWTIVYCLHLFNIHPSPALLPHSVFQMTLVIEMPAHCDAKPCYESKDRHAYHCNNRIFLVNSKPAGVLAMIYSLCLFPARMVLNNVTSTLFWSVYWEFLLTPLSVVGRHLFSRAFWIQLFSSQCRSADSWFLCRLFHNFYLKISLLLTAPNLTCMYCCSLSYRH